MGQRLRAAAGNRQPAAKYLNSQAWAEAALDPAMSSVD